MKVLGAAVRRAGEYPVSGWAGGQTAEIAIDPPGAAYAAGDFLWRVSSATVTAEESVFTPLPGVRRQLMLLEGELALTHDGGKETALAPFETDAFSGGALTKSRGICRDFNLMMRQSCTGALEHLAVAGRTELLLPAGGQPGRRTAGVYAARGGLTVEYGDGACTLRPQDFLRIDYEGDGQPLRLVFEAENNADAVLVRISYEGG